MPEILYSEKVNTHQEVQKPTSGPSISFTTSRIQYIASLGYFVKFSGPAPRKSLYANFLSRLPHKLQLNWYRCRGYNYLSCVAGVQARGLTQNPAEGTMDVTLSYHRLVPLFLTLLRRHETPHTSPFAIIENQGKCNPVTKANSIPNDRKQDSDRKE